MIVDNATPFRFGIDQTVRFQGTQITGVVLGRLHDKNGHHYELIFDVQGVPTRRWITDAELEAL